MANIYSRLQMDSKLIRNWTILMLLVISIIIGLVVFLNWNKQKQTGAASTSQTAPFQTMENGVEDTGKESDYREFLNDPFFFDEE